MDRTRLNVQAHRKDCPTQKILGETIIARANPAHFEWSIFSGDAPSSSPRGRLEQADKMQKRKVVTETFIKAEKATETSRNFTISQEFREVSVAFSALMQGSVAQEPDTIVPISPHMVEAKLLAASPTLSPALDKDARNFWSPRETVSALQSAPSSLPRRPELRRADEHLFTSLSSRCSPVPPPPSSQSEYKTSQAMDSGLGGIVRKVGQEAPESGLLIELDIEMDDIVGREVAFADRLSAHVTQSLELTDARVAPRWVKVTSFRCKPFRAHVSFGSSESCGGKGGGISNIEAAFRLHVQAKQLASPLRAGEIGKKIRGAEILNHEAPDYYSEASQVHSHLQEARERDEGRNRSQEARKKNEEAEARKNDEAEAREARKSTSEALLPQLKCVQGLTRDDEDVLGASCGANLAKHLINLQLGDKLGDKLAKATRDLGKNLEKAGEKLIEVWDLNDLKNDTMEMKEHVLKPHVSASQARSEGFSHGNRITLKLRVLSPSRSSKEEHTRRQGEEEKRGLKEEAATRRRFLATLVGLRLDTSEDEAAPSKVRARVRGFVACSAGVSVRM